MLDESFEVPQKRKRSIGILGCKVEAIVYPRDKSALQIIYSHLIARVVAERQLEVCPDTKGKENRLRGGLTLGAQEGWEIG